MIQNRLLYLLAVLIFSAAESVLAVPAGGDAVDEALATRIVDRLKEARPEFDYRDVTATPIPGIFQVQVVGGPILYVANEGEFLF